MASFLSMHGQAQVGFQQACLTMRRVTEAVDTLPDSLLDAGLENTQPSSILAARVRDLEVLRQLFHADLNKLRTKQLADSHMEQAHSGFITCFGELVVVLLPQLSKLTRVMVKHELSQGHGGRKQITEISSSNTSLHVSIFKILFDLLCVSCLRINEWPSTWPPSSNTTQLQLTLHSLSSWLSTSTHQNSEAWGVLKQMHAGLRWALILITPQIHSLSALSVLSLENIMRSFARLPPNFISTLCQFACEQAADVPTSRTPNTATAKPPKLFMYLAIALSDLHAITRKERKKDPRHPGGACSPRGAEACFGLRPSS